jgi:hypothetical protein
MLVSCWVPAVPVKKEKEVEKAAANELEDELEDADADAAPRCGCGQVDPDMYALARPLHVDAVSLLN